MTHRGHRGGSRSVKVDVDVKRRGPRYPVAAGVAVGAAIAIGTRAYTLPTRCTKIDVGNVVYHECSGAYYKPYYEGTTVVYVVVDAP